MARNSVSGDRQLLAAMRQMSQSPKAAEMDSIALGALEILRDEVAHRAPIPSLRKGVVARRVRAKGRTRRTYWVAFKRGLAMRVAHLREFGVQPHSLKKGASVRKGIFVGHKPMHPGYAPQPFMRPAFEATKADVVRDLGQRVWAVISKAALGVRGR